MKKVVATVGLCLSLAASAFCESSVWVAKTDSSVLYIGGTIHLLRDSDKPFPPEYERAYKESETVVFETDFVELQKPETQQAIMAKGMYAEGRTLEDVLSEDAYRQLSDYCEASGLPLEQLNQFKPSMVLLTIMGVELQKTGALQKGIDMHYHARATEDQRTIDGLETVTEQIDMLTSMGEGYESAYIIYNLSEMEHITESFDKLVKAWKVGDDSTLTDMFIVEFKRDFPKLFDLILADRNAKWAPEIEAYLLTPETEFVLVGAAHLLGKDGVLALLEERGYAVEKMK